MKLLMKKGVAGLGRISLQPPSLPYETPALPQFTSPCRRALLKDQWTPYGIDFAPFQDRQEPREGRHLRKINLLSLTQPSPSGVVDA